MLQDVAYRPTIFQIYNEVCRMLNIPYPLSISAEPLFLSPTPSKKDFPDDVFSEGPFRVIAGNSTIQTINPNLNINPITPMRRGRPSRMGGVAENMSSTSSFDSMGTQPNFSNSIPFPPTFQQDQTVNPYTHQPQNRHVFTNPFDLQQPPPPKPPRNRNS